MKTVFNIFICMLFLNVVAVWAFAYANHAEPISYINIIGVALFGYVIKGEKENE